MWIGTKATCLYRTFPLTMLQIYKSRNDQTLPHTEKPHHPSTKQSKCKYLKTRQGHKHQRGDDRGTALERSASRKRDTGELKPV